jgi:undecaprenyl-diphosphatase
MTLLLVMLHSGTMFSVVVYFWNQWKRIYFGSAVAFKRFAAQVLIATFFTGLIGLTLMKLIEKVFLRGLPHAQVEDIFGHLEMVSPALAFAGILILLADLSKRRGAISESQDLSTKQAGLMGIVQGLCLPFRGLSRSGATISTGMLLGVRKSRAEAFSFALAVVLTPLVIARELMRAVESSQGNPAINFSSFLIPSFVGAGCAFLAGLLALRWLSAWLERGRWYLFGIYCLFAATVVECLYLLGY